MKKLGISRKDIQECLIDGSLEIKQFVKGEIRYGKVLNLRRNIIVVIYVITKDCEERVVTTYFLKKRRGVFL